jgi:hypothetical protein
LLRDVYLLGVNCHTRVQNRLPAVHSLIANTAHQLSKHLSAHHLATALLKAKEIETAGERNFMEQRKTEVQGSE